MEVGINFVWFFLSIMLSILFSYILDLEFDQKNPTKCFRPLAVEVTRKFQVVFLTPLLLLITSFGG